MKAEIVDQLDFSEYEELLQNNEQSTFYTSKKHLNFLDIIKVKPSFITVREKNKLLGVLPFFSKKEIYGTVINSLPFFGSYGGTITKNYECEKIILDEFNIFNKENDILSAVIIDNPFYQKSEIYKKYFEYHTIEERLIQATNLKNKSEIEIWKNFEKRVRWSIKKSEKNEIKIEIESSNEHMKKFYELHKNSMESKEGRAKPFNIFEKILKNFTPSEDFDIFVAKKDHQSIAYVLIFYFKNFAEYYLTAYDPRFLSYQSTSNLIWNSMKKSISKGIEYYNFGGTWKTQTDLYRFKRGWNTSDFNYNYFIYRDLDKIKDIGIENILKKYEYFYICPINEIRND